MARENIFRKIRSKKHALNQSSSLSDFVICDKNWSKFIFKNKVHNKFNKLKNLFIPYAGNKHAPHMLRPARAAFYSFVFLTSKILVFTTIMLVPVQAYLLPDVLLEQKKELITLIHNFRLDNNLADLSLNDELEKSAQLKADDMAQNSYFSHTAPDGRDFKYFLRQGGYDYKTAGENLAMGFNNAKDVMQAWLASPLHYKNLADYSFTEMGIGINSGLYKNRDTVFIANHFGEPFIEYDNNIFNTNINNNGKILSSNVTNNINYDKSQSHVYWSYDGHQTKFIVQAYIQGDITNAFVTIDREVIPLQANPQDSNWYQGELYINKNINDFFKVIVTPTITIANAEDIKLVDGINWYSIKVVSPTPLETYMNAHQLLPNILKPVFTTEKIIYIMALVFFALALTMNIIFQIKTQRPHIIVFTFLLLALLVTLIVV